MRKYASRPGSIEKTMVNCRIEFFMSMFTERIGKTIGDRFYFLAATLLGQKSFKRKRVLGVGLDIWEVWEVLVTLPKFSFGLIPPALHFQNSHYNFKPFRCCKKYLFSMSYRMLELISSTQQLVNRCTTSFIADLQACISCRTSFEGLLCLCTICKTNVNT